MKLELQLSFEQSEFLTRRSSELQHHFSAVYGVDEVLTPEDLVVMLIDQYREAADPDPDHHVPQPPTRS